MLFMDLCADKKTHACAWATHLTYKCTKKTMCFTTKRDNIPDLKLNGEMIETVNEFKYLGMTLDAPYLTWEPRIGKIVTNSLKTINLMRVLAGTKWGADRQSLLKINEALIRSKIAYGCPAFISAAESNLKKLEVIQNAALRLALGVWRSTRIPNLQVEANVVPVKLFIKQQIIDHYLKLKAQGPTTVLTSRYSTILT